ncbi:MAG: nucleotide exchange factor GrpE [Candidatus Nanohaloarchaea archaeon]|nr:nucleotide exchange factor GrpE [Candidatus Nanohaloarchaea archaeon]
MAYSQLSREQLEEALQHLEEELQEERERREEIERAAKQIKADFENYKKEQQERKERWQEEARKELAEDLISILDNLERAIMSAEEDSSLYQGVKMVADQLYEALAKRGLQRIDAEGEEFDPRLHSAVDTEEHHTDDEVLEMRRAGYMYGDDVLREAEVVVGKDTTGDES